jgi:hypothetical protein
VNSWLEKRGFLDPLQVCEPRDRGHAIGPHPLSHPDFMSGPVLLQEESVRHRMNRKPDVELTMKNHTLKESCRRAERSQRTNYVRRSWTTQSSARGARTPELGADE